MRYKTSKRELQAITIDSGSIWVNDKQYNIENGYITLGMDALNTEVNSILSYARRNNIMLSIELVGDVNDTALHGNIMGQFN